MAEVKWIKIVTDIFDNKKIKQIEKIPNGDTILVIWFKLIVLAGVTNDDGLVYITDEIPYNSETLSNEFNKPLNEIKIALDIFQKFKMIEIIDDFIRLKNWQQYQNVDGLEKIRSQTRLRVQKYRENQRLLLEDKECNVTRNVTVTQSNAPRIRIENKNKNIFNNLSNDKLFVLLIEKWNELPDTISKISTLKKDTQRYKMLSQRINEYGSDKILEAIDKIKQSSFLLGQNKSGWTITFEWFVRPNNFIKVLEGNYIDKKINKGNFAKGKYIEQQDILSEEEKQEKLKNNSNSINDLFNNY
jgi:phage replisome organizer N-terminal domain protein|nr:MAG TPA: replisome organizer [Caudoviricetes sp.]